ncbi:hypothetical protein AeMF1_009295 [Aphanomyces euteiches]|nr:hypothetical protein AeMF1_009295 [Aphanomyces euteiches]
MVTPIIRLCRLLGRSNAKVALIGSHGHGKYATAMIAAKMMDQKLIHFEAQVDQDAAKIGWKEALKQVVITAGVLENDVTFIVQNVNIMPNILLEQLSLLLHDREVPLIFSPEEQCDMALNVKQEKMHELRVSHQTQLDKLRREISSEKNARLKEQHESVRQAINGSKELNNKTAKERELEAMLALEKEMDRFYQQKVDALLSVQQSEVDDLTRRFEATVDIQSSLTMAVIKPSGVLSGIWNGIMRSVSRNTRIIVCCESGDIGSLVQRVPKLLTKCQICSAPALTLDTIQILFHHQIGMIWKRFMEQEEQLKSSVLLNSYSMIEANLDKISSLAASLHLIALQVSQSCSKGNVVISLHQVPRYVQCIFDAMKRLQIHINQLLSRSRSFLDLYYMAVEKVDTAQKKQQEKILHIQDTSAHIDELKIHLEKTQEEADLIRDNMKQYKADVDDQVKITNDMDKATKHELKDALKILDDANRSVANLDRRYIMEIKTFVNPPVLVHVVLNAMCVLFSVEPSWENAKRLLSDVNFISSMLNYDKDNIPEHTLTKLEPYLTNEMFNKTEVEKQSIAASTMVVWIIAIDSYSRSRKLVKPKLDILEAAQLKLRGLVAKFSECKKNMEKAEKVSSDIEESIQARIEEKKQLEIECQSLEKYLGEGNGMLKIMEPEEREIAEYLNSMIEYEATILAEAVISAAMKTYAVSEQLLRIHSTCSILNGYTSQSFGIWLKAAGMFHSQHNQTTAYILAYAQPVVMITSFSSHVEAMILNVFHVIGCNSVVVKQAHDKDIRSVVESCMTMGQQLIINDVTPSLFKTVFHDLVEWETKWIDGLEHVIYQDRTIQLKRGFRLVLTSPHSLHEFGSKTFRTFIIDGSLCWDDMENVLLDDIELSSLFNDKTKLGAYDHSRQILDMEIDSDRAFDGLLTHMRSMILESSYDATMLDTLSTMCQQNARNRAMLDESRQMLNRVLEKSAPIYSSYARIGSVVFSALTSLNTQTPNNHTFEAYGFRMLFIQCLESSLNDARVKPTGDRICTPGDLLAKLLDVLSLSVPQDQWTTFLLLLAIEIRSEWKEDSKSVNVSDDANQQIAFQICKAYMPTSVQSIVTADTIQKLQKCTPEQLYAAFTSHRRDESIVKRNKTTQPPISAVQASQDEAVTSTLSSLSAASCCVLIMLTCSISVFEAFCEILYSNKLGLDLKTSASRGRSNCKEWFKILQNMPDHWFWCIASNHLATSFELLHLVLETIVPRQSWPDILSILLQRPDVRALPFEVPHEDENSVIAFFKNIQTMTHFEGSNPVIFQGLRWLIVTMDSTDKWDSILQYSKKYRIDYRPVGVISHLKLATSKPKHHRHVADEDMPATRLVHIVQTKASKIPYPIPLGDCINKSEITHVPMNVEPNRLILHPMGSSRFSFYFRRTTLRLVSMPFSSTIGDCLKHARLDATSMKIISIVTWRLICGLIFLHSSLLTRQCVVVGCAVDFVQFDMGDLVMGVHAITGPILHFIVEAFSTVQEGDPLDLLDWAAVQDAFMKYAYLRKCISKRGEWIIRNMLMECVGPYLIIPNSSPIQSRFRLPLPAFQEVLKTPTQSTGDYLNVLCSFSTPCNWSPPDVAQNEPTILFDPRLFVLKQKPMKNNAKAHLAAIISICLNEIPAPLPLKGNPRSGGSQHPLRNFLKTIVQEFIAHRDEAISVFSKLLEELDDVDDRLDQIPNERLHNDLLAILKDEIPPSLKSISQPVVMNMTLPNSIEFLKLRAKHLQLWWNKNQSEYLCPAIFYMEDFIRSFLLSSSISSNIPLDRLSAIGQVYPLNASIEPFRNRSDSILLTGLELLNAKPTEKHSLECAPGEIVPVNVLLRAVEDNKEETMDCPILPSRLNCTSAGAIKLKIVPSLQNWAAPFYRDN